MASNLAARRAAKANRRKAVVAGKRKIELMSGSLAAQVSAAASQPIRACLISDGWMEAGMGTLFLTRGISNDRLGFGMFLLDTYCLGIKDVAFKSMDAGQWAAFLDASEYAMPLSPIDPGFGRKLLRDLAAWSASMGFAPHPDFATVERLFGTVSADTCTTEFQFGREGKPFYIQGPSDTPAQARQRLAQVSRATGGSGKILLLEPDEVGFDVPSLSWIADEEHSAADASD
jgi:hypothetical protein